MRGRDTIKQIQNVKIKQYWMFCPLKLRYSFQCAFKRDSAGCRGPNERGRCRPLVNNYRAVSYGAWGLGAQSLSRVLLSAEKYSDRCCVTHRINLSGIEISDFCLQFVLLGSQVF